MTATMTRPRHDDIVVMAPDRCTQYLVRSTQPTADQIADWCHRSGIRSRTNSIERELGLV